MPCTGNPRPLHIINIGVHVGVEVVVVGDVILGVVVIHVIFFIITNAQQYWLLLCMLCLLFLCNLDLCFFLLCVFRLCFFLSLYFLRVCFFHVCGLFEPWLKGDLIVLGLVWTNTSSRSGCVTFCHRFSMTRVVHLTGRFFFPLWSFSFISV